MRTTPVGEVEVSWRVEGEDFLLDVVVPDEVGTEVVLPDGSITVVVGGQHAFGCRWSVSA